VANSSTGKWVSRVASSGGGKAYRKARPNTYYLVLAVIVILGLAATIYSRHEYQHPAGAAIGPSPQIGQTYYAALSVEACGKVYQPLAANPSKLLRGLTLQANNVIKIKPVNAADAGTHATLAQFALEYSGLTATNNELAIPTAAGVPTAATTFKNGQSCPKGSKYAGQTGEVQYAYWSSFGQSSPTITTDPGSIHLSKQLRVTMAFEPKSVTPLAPSQATINAMFVAGQTTTTTAATLSTTTTAPTTASTVAPTTTTTAKG
jgi:hypothetical protein